MATSADGNGAEAPVWSTTDLGTAAYVKFRGLDILGVRSVGGQFVFEFSDPNGQARRLQIDYINSECRRYDEAVRSLKKLCYDGQPRRRRVEAG